MPSAHKLVSICHHMPWCPSSHFCRKRTHKNHGKPQYMVFGQEANQWRIASFLETGTSSGVKITSSFQWARRIDPAQPQGSLLKGEMLESSQRAAALKKERY